MATGYTGDHQLTFSGANPSPAPSTAPTVTDKTSAAVPFGSATTITFANGVATAGGSLKLYDAENATIAVTDGSISAAGADALAVAVAPGALAKFALQLTSPQANGAAFTGANTLTAEDAYGNVKSSFSAFADHVTVTANAPLGGVVSGLHGANVLNNAADFVNGVADLTSLGLTYTGNAASGTFTATAGSGPSGTSGLVNVHAAAATRLVLTGAAAQTAGQAQTITVTAEDLSGNTDTTYTGDHSLTFSGAAPVGSFNPTVTDKSGSAVAFGTATTLTFTNGVATAGGSMVLYKAQNATVAATDGAISATGADRLGVAVSAAPISSFSLAAASTAPTAGATDSLTVTALDPYGNTATSYAGDHAVTFGGAGSSASPATAPTVTDKTGSAIAFGTATTLTFTSGVATAGGTMQLYKAETAHVTVDDGAHSNGSGLALSVSAGAPAKLAITQVNGGSSPTAGAGFPVVVQSQDPYGNASAVSTGTAFGFSRAAGTGTLGGTAGGTIAASQSQVTVTGVTYSKAEPGVQLTATRTSGDNLTAGTSAAFTVSALADRLVVTSVNGGGNPVAGTPFSVTVEAHDGNGNPGNVNASTDVVLSLNTGTGTLGGTLTGTIPAGQSQVTISGVTYGKAESGVTVGVVRTSGDNLLAGVSASFTVDPGAASRFVITGSATQTAGTPNTLTIAAEDANGNVATGYTGDKSLTFSGASTIGSNAPTVTDKSGAAVAFGTATTVTFASGVATAGGSMVLYKAESATIAAAATGVTTTGGDRLAVTVTPASTSRFVVSTTAGTPQTAGTPFSVTVTAKDQFDNVTPSYAGTVDFGSTDGQAMLPSQYVFTTGAGNDNGTHVFTGVVLKTAGSESVAVTDHAAPGITGTSPTLSVEAAAADHLVVATSAGAPDTAGSAFDATVTAKDAYGNTDTSYTGTVDFTSNDPAAVLPASYAFQAGDGGTRSFPGGVTLKTAGAARTVTATDHANASITGTAHVDVSAAAATHLSVTTTAGAPQTAGVAFATTVSARDAYQNVADAYTGTVHFTSTDPQAALPSDYTFTAGDSGSHTFATVALETAGSRTVTATDTVTGSIAGSSSAITVAPAAAAKFVVTGAGSQTAGASQSITVTAYDAFGNTASGYTGPKTVTFSGASSSTSPVTAPTVAGAAFGTGTSLTFTNGSVTAPLSLFRAETAHVVATDGGVTTTGADRLDVNVAAAAASRLDVTTAAGTPQTAGTPFSATVTARDPYGNVADSYTGGIHFTTTDPLAAPGTGLPADYTFVAGDGGTHTFTNAVTLRTAGSQTVTATDTILPGINGSSSSVTVSPAATDHFVVSSSAGSPQTAGGAIDLTVVAKDAYGNTTPAYAGTPVFTSSDPQAVLPSGYTFTSGSHTFTGGVTLKTAGAQTVTATDGPVSGQTSITVGPAAADHFTVTTSAGSVNAGSALDLTVTAKDAYGNTDTNYTGTAHFTSNDPQASLPADYTFSSGSHTFTGGLTLKTAGSRTVTATAGPVTGTSAAVAVSPLAVSSLELSAATTTPTAGAGDAITVTARDAYGNVATSYTGSRSLTFGGAGSIGANVPVVDGTAFGAGTSMSFSGGVATASMTLYKAESAQVTVTDGTHGNGAGLPVTVGAAADSDLAITSVNGGASPTAGAGFPVVVESHDTYGNRSPVAAATSFGLTRAAGSGTLAGTVTGTIAAGQSQATVSGVTYTKAESGVQLTATQTSGDTLNAGTSAAFTVSSLADRLVVTDVNGGADPTAGAGFAVTVQAQDANGNPGNVASATNVQLSLSTGSGTLGGTLGGQIPAGQSQVTISGVTYTKAEVGVKLGASRTTGPLLVAGVSAAFTVDAGAAAKFVVTGSGTQTAGTPNQLTITAEDVNGNVATGYTGDRSVTLSGANASSSPATTPTVTDKANGAVGFGTPATLTFTNGVATAGGSIVLYRAETATIVATAGPITTTGPDALPVVVSPASTSRFDVTAPATSTAGSPFDLTVTAKDAWGNTTPTYGGTVHFTSSDGGAVVPSDSSLSSGTRTFTSGVTLRTSGSQTVTATDGALTGQASVAVSAAAAMKLRLAGSATQTAGTAQALTISAYDQYGNVATGYTGDKQLTFAGASASGSPVTQPTVTSKSAAAIAFGSATTVTFTNGVATAGGSMKLYAAENATITATDGTLSATGPDALAVAVSPAALSKFAFQLASPQTNGVAFAGTDTLTAEDAYGNTVTTFSALADPVTVSANGALAGAVTGLSGGNVLNGAGDFSNGVATLTGSLTYTGPSGAGTFTATAQSGSAGTSASVTVSPGAATKFVLGGNPTQTAGASQSLAITAEDGSGNTATSYTGSHSLTFSGAGTVGSFEPAVAGTAFGSPTSVFFTAGVASPTLTLYRAETARVVATAGSVTTTGADRLAVAVSEAAPDAAASVISASPATQTADGTSAIGITVQANDAYGNHEPAGGSTVVLDTTRGTLAGVVDNSDGSYSSSLTSTSAGAATISGTLDGTPIGATVAVTFTPGPVDAARSTLTPVGSTIAADGVATRVLAVQAKDANGNDLTTGGATVAITQQSGTGSISSVSYAGSGRYTATVTSPTSVGSGVFVATINGQAVKSGTAAQTQATVNYAAGNATKLAITSVPATASAGQDFSVTIEAEDANGNPAVVGQDTDVALALASRSGGGAAGSLTGTTSTIAAGDSSVTLSHVQYTKAEDVTLDATRTAGDALAAAPASTTISVGPGTASGATSTLTPTAATLTADGSTQVLTVQVEDAFGNALTSSGDTVTITRQSGAGSVGSAVYAGNGRYTATVTAPTTVGSGTFVATVNAQPVKSGTAAQTQSTVTYVPGPADAAHSTLTPAAANVTAGGSTQVLTLQVKDANGNDLTTGADTVTITKQSGTGSIGSVTYAGNGRWQATVTSPALTGSAVFAATVNGTAVPGTSTLTYVSGNAVASQSTLAPASSSITADGASTQVLTVQARDAGGNALTADTATVTITKQSGSGSIGAVTYAGGGRYTATVTAPTTSGSGVFEATVNGQPLSATATVAYAPGAPDGARSTVVATTPTPSTDDAPGTTVTVTVLDPFGNPVPNTPVTLTPDTGSSTIAPALQPVNTNASGVAAFDVTDAVAETVVYSATAGVTPVTQTAAVSFQPGAPAQALFGQQPTNATAGATIAPAITVRILDAHGNLAATSENVTLAGAGGSPALFGTTTVAAVGGVATFNNVAVHTAGAGYKLTATTALSGLTVDSGAFDVAVGPASAADSKLAVDKTQINHDGSSGNVAVTVTAYDAYGNREPAGGATVVVATSLGSASGVTDNGDGTYGATVSPTGTNGTAHITATLDGSAVGQSKDVQIVDPVPVTVIDSGPSGAVASSTAAFTFHSTNSSPSFECSMDSTTAYSSCPASYTGLADGSHTFRVRGFNGNGTGTPAAQSFTVDTTGPTVALTTAPGAYTNNATEPLAASASDATTSVSSVDFFFAAHGSACATGTLIGTDTTSPYDSIAWTTPSDGQYDLCAVATDAVGNSTTSALVTTTVDQTPPTASLAALGAYARGNLTLTPTTADNLAGLATTRLEVAAAGSGVWSTVTSPYDTTSRSDGSYDFRVVAIDRAGNRTDSAARTTLVDNTPPATNVDTPVANADVRGTIGLSATSSDTGSGLGSTTFEISPHGAGTWSPVAASFDTTAKPDGLYDVRSVATDNAGNQAASTPVQIRIDNTPPTATLGTLAQYVRGSIALDSTGTADAGSGLASVAFQIVSHGGSGWSPVTSPFDTSSQADGSYDVRVHAVDNAGNTADSPVQTIVIDNTAPNNVTLDAPAAAAVVHGTIPLSATAQDVTSGIASTVFRAAAAGTLGANPCNQFGTALTSPFDTTALTDGHYDLWVAATDRAGNGRCSVVPHDVTVDNTPPVTHDDAPFGARNADVTVTLSATDNLTGVATTEYRLDGGSWTTGTSIVVPAPANHSNDGVHTIDYRSTDGAGNVEATKSTSVTIDTTAPSGSAVDPSNILSGTVSLTASPTETDIASVRWEFRPAGSLGPYTTIGTDNTAPWTMSWITTGPSTPDGQYDVQVVFTDTTGNTSVQPLSTKTIDNTAPASATVTAPAAGSDVGGVIAFASSATDATTSIDNARTTYEVEATGDSAFAPVSGSSWNSTSKPDGPAQVRVAVWDVAGNGPTYSAPVAFTIDNTAPSVSLTAPATTNGVAGLSATGSADIASVKYEYTVHGGSSWTGIGTASSAPFAKAWNTAALSEGLYDVRATATDGGGNTGTDVKTVLVDRTGPTGTLTAPAAGATVGGTNVPLAATATDDASGVASVEFQYRLHGSGNPFTDAATDTSSPYGAAWDVTGLTDGQYDVQILVTDNAGNTTVAGSRVIDVDTTAPTLSGFSVASPAAGTFPLSVTTSGDTTRVTYAMRPAGGSTWSTIGSATTGTTFRLPFDSTTVTDGGYDFRAAAEDQFGNTAVLVASNVTIDNTAPTLTGSSPTDGAVVPALASVTATASEPLSAVSSLRLDDQPAAFVPAISGANVTFPVGAVPNGNHALTGKLVDLVGNEHPFRINFTVDDGTMTDVPPTSINVSGAQPTTLGSVDSSATVTVPANVWQRAVPTPQDWLVLRVDPIPATSPLVTPPPPSSGSTFSYAETVVDVRMFWNLSGNDEHDFDAPIQIDLTDATGTGTPATKETTTPWRAIDACAAPGTLPANAPDCYWRAGGMVHILTRHLSIFAILNGFQITAKLVPPIDFAAVVASDGLTLRWAPGVPTDELRLYTLYADGTAIGTYGPQQFEAKLGQIASDDTRRFWMTETNTFGGESGPSTVMRAVPPVAGLTVADATQALAARTFTVGTVTPVFAPGVPAGTVVGPTDVAVQTEGTPVDLQVASSSAPHSLFAFSVASAPRARITASGFVGRVLLTERGRVDVTLDARPYVRIQRWHFFHVSPGATILRLKLRTPLRPGTYRLYWKATGESSRQVARRITPLRMLPNRGSLHAGSPPDVVVVTSPRLEQSAASLPGRVHPLTAEQTYLYATYHDVPVIAVDASAPHLVASLRTVFPSTNVVAVPRNTSAQKLRALIAAALKGR
ncbi:MAG TPA: invasin domain 3-containing protein [Gaiellaceae bacterium]